MDEAGMRRVAGLLYRPVHVSVPAPPPTTPLHRGLWPLLALVALVCGGLLALDTHLPPPRDDAATAWFAYVRADSPVTRGIDWLNASAPVTPDLPAASALVLLALGVTLLATLRALTVPAWLAVAVATGALAARSVWSTATQGHDALPVLAVSLAVLLTTRSSATRWLPLASVVTALLAPAAVVLTLPALTRMRASIAVRLATGAIVMTLALAAQAVSARLAWRGIPCLSSAAWSAALLDVLRPGLSADASAWVAVRQWASVLGSDVHAFGLVVAVFGLVVAGADPAHATRRADGPDVRLPLRRATIVALVLTLVSVATGMLPPAFAASLFLPWWAPWFGVGLARLVARTAGRQRAVAVVFAALTAIAVPLLQSATVMPGPWVAGTPAMARAALATVRDEAIVVRDMPSARRIRAAGARALPGDPLSVAACLATGAQVSVLGDAVASVERVGFATDDEPLRAPMVDVIRDLRGDQLVALAVAPLALPWMGPQALGVLERLDVQRQQALATAALAIVARTDRGGRVVTRRDSAEVALAIGDSVDGRQLAGALTVRADAVGTAIDAPPRRLATGAAGVIAVFDRSQGLVLRSAAMAEKGLTVALGTHAQWRRSRVSGQPQCEPSGPAWTAMSARAARIAVPIGAATTGNPTLVFLAADAPLQPQVHGLPSDMRSGEVSIDSFDTRHAADADRLSSLAEHDGLAGAGVPRGRWVARVAITPRDVWHPSHVSVASGGADAAWATRLSSDGRRASTTDVCRMDAAGERLFYGHFGAVDDDSPYEVGVRMLEGWHAPERLHGLVHQWTSRPTATATFTLAKPRDLVLALDAEAATTPQGPQPLTVRVNGQVLVLDRPGASRTTVPASLLRLGRNVLALEVGQVVQPPGDARTLGVLVRQLRLIEMGSR